MDTPDSPAGLRGPLQTIPVDGHTFGYHSFGSGPDLVLFNGDAMCMSLWTDALLQRLARNHTVTIFDYPGLGQSMSTESTSWEIPYLAQLHLSFLRELGLDKPDLLGWSTGGEIILHMAISAGDQLGRLVSVAGDPGSSHFVGDPNILTKLAEASDVEVMGMLFPESKGQEMGAFVQDIMSRPQDEPTPEVSKAQDAAFQTWLAAGIWDQLGEIRNPTLFVNGTKDLLVPAENAVNMAGRVPGAWLVQVPEAGHAVLLQEPEFCCALIDLFLKRD